MGSPIASQEVETKDSLVGLSNSCGSASRAPPLNALPLYGGNRQVAQRKEHVSACGRPVKKRPRLPPGRRTGGLLMAQASPPPGGLAPSFPFLGLGLGAAALGGAASCDDAEGNLFWRTRAQSRADSISASSLARHAAHCLRLLVTASPTSPTPAKNRPFDQSTLPGI